MIQITFHFLTIISALTAGKYDRAMLVSTILYHTPCESGNEKGEKLDFDFNKRTRI